jgi:hypothetical protein
LTVPVHTTIPDSTLTPEAARRKISASGVRGLGCSLADDFYDCDVDVYDSGGNWWDQFIPSPDAGLTTYNPQTITFDQYLHTQPNGEAYPFDPYTIGTSTGGAGSVFSVDSHVDPSGVVMVDLSNGQQIALMRDGKVVRGSGSTATYSGGNYTLTQQQTNAWPSLVNALVQAGVRLGTVAMLPQGTSLTPNGTIVGSGQSLVRPGVITSNSLTSGINAMLQNPMFLIAGFGLIALAVFSGGGRR